MLVKIVAMGHTPALWKNVFHHLRVRLGELPFAAGIFSSEEEVRYLLEGFFPHQWRREQPDFLLCEPPAGPDWKRQQAFLREVKALADAPPVGLGLALHTLEHGLRSLVQGPAPVEVHLGERPRLHLSDPALVVPSFPAEFPRLRVNEHVQALHPRPAAGRAAGAVAPEAVPRDTVIGLNELEAVVQGEQALPPAEWLRRTLRAERLRLPEDGPVGLLREANGLFLFPGVPADHVTGITLGDVTFDHLLDLGQLNEHSRLFRALREAVQRCGEKHRRTWQGVTARTRTAEARTDVPVVCAGGPPLLREGLAAVLRGRGFARCACLAEPQEGYFREPALALQLADWRLADWGTQVEQPHLWELRAELEPLGEPLEGLLDWRALTAATPMPEREGGPLSGADIAREAEDLAARRRKAEEGLRMAKSRRLLLQQEAAVQQAALERLQALLEGPDAPQTWTGRLPAGARQVAVFSHDAEEAGALLQALPRVARKRWFDLSRYTDADSLRGLALDTLQDYRQDGALLITLAARERLQRLRTELAGAHADSEAALQECEEARAFYSEQCERLQDDAEALARRWVHDALSAWLDASQTRLLERLGAVRTRHERRWFSRALVSRVIMIPSSGENRVALQAACRRLYPRLNEGTSHTVHYDFEPLEALPDEDRRQVEQEAREAAEANPEAPPESTLRQRLARRLDERNEARLGEYLEVLSTELAGAHGDLLLIEHRREVAFAVLEHLRARHEALADVPAIVILPDYWAPPKHAGLPWPWVRVLCVRRMGALSSEDCVRHIEALYAA